MEWSIPSSTAKRPTGSRNKDDRGKRRRGGKEREQEVLQEGGGSSFMFNHFNRSSPRLGLCAGIKTAAGENRWKFRESQRRARRRRALVLFCRLVMQVTRVTASIDFPSLPPRPPLSPLSDRFRWIRADNWVSAIERTNRQGIEPRKRTSGKLGEYIFHFFTAPSSHPLLRPRSAIYLRSLSTSREHDRDVENEKTNGEEGRGDGIIDETRDRWIASRIIPFLSRSLNFFFSLPFFQQYFITYSQ